MTTENEKFEKIKNGLVGCSNHNCYIKPPVGMGTNGSCHCLDDKTKIQRFIYIANYERDALKASAELKDQEIAELRDRLNKIATDWQVMKIELKSADVLLTEYNKWDIESKEKIDSKNLQLMNLSNTIAELTAQNAKLREAGQAVVDRWHTPNWKDVEHTGVFIHRLEEALASTQPQSDICL